MGGLLLPLVAFTDHLFVRDSDKLILSKACSNVTIRQQCVAFGDKRVIQSGLLPNKAGGLSLFKEKSQL
jgi:hypothetical protein